MMDVSFVFGKQVNEKGMPSQQDFVLDLNLL